jgi:hypothetical protein
MNSRVMKLAVLFAILMIAVFSTLPRAAAQQITYYSFDNTTSYSYGCSDPAANPEVVNPLLCFNGSYPYLGYDFFPANVDPSNTGGSYHNALYLHYASSQNETAWFSLPQDITDGFTTYFAFRVNPNGAPPADGFAFVIQNATGSGTEGYSGLNCTESYTGGPTVLGDVGGCMGYGGIDHSFAVEFDTFTNPFDPGYSHNNFSSANHIALQNCATDPNSPNHGTSEGESGCLVDHDGLANNLSVSMSDGQVHQVVVQYDGDSSGNINVYLDPPFVPGTHTPCHGEPEAPCNSATAVPVIQCPYQIGAAIGLTSPGGKAYVGFTGATEATSTSPNGPPSETTDILAWTFTSHTTSSQQQSLNSGSPTTFPFGQHTYTVNYPSGVDTTNIDMIVDSLPIAPGDFDTLINEGPFNGTHCQTYEGTGTPGNPNCIIYSVHCVFHGSGIKTTCPSTSDPIIPVKTAYESDTTVTPDSPGFLQGDPLFAQISQITESGNVATVHCLGECFAPDTPPTAVRLHNTTGFDGGPYPVTSVVSIDSFTITHGPGDSDETGGYVTSDNVKDICNPPGDPTPCWQPNRIDGTTSGKTKNFSEFVAISLRAGPPSFTSADHATFTTSGPNSFLVTTNSVTPDTLTSSDAPAGLVIGGNDGHNAFTLSGTVPGGTYTFHLVADNGQSATQTFTLTVPSLSSIAVTPANPAVPSGLSQQFTATGTYTDASTQDLTNSVTWSTGSSSIAVISNVSGSKGVATAVNVGNTSVTATLGSVSGSTTIYAIAPVINALAIAPTTATINQGQMQTYTATATYSDGSQAVVANNTLSWTSDASGVATVNSSGVATGAGGGTAHIKATSGSVNSNSATLNVNASSPSQISVTPTSLPFGDVNLGSSKSLTLTVKNTGSSNSLKITNITFNYGHTGSGSNYGYTTQCGGTLKAGKTCTITVTLKAQDLGPGTAQLIIAYNMPGSPVTVNLSGNVINPKASVSPGSLSYGTVKVGQKSTKAVTITSSGTTALIIGSIVTTGSSDFSIVSNTCPISPSSLAPHNSCTVTVKFAPSAKQSRSGTLKITDNANSSPQTVSLSGKCN